MLDPVPRFPTHKQRINSVMSGRPKNWLPNPEHMPTFEQYETKWRLFDALSREQASWRNDVEGIAPKRHLLNLPNLNEATLWYARNSRSSLEQSFWNPFPSQQQGSPFGCTQVTDPGKRIQGSVRCYIPRGHWLPPPQLVA